MPGKILPESHRDLGLKGLVVIVVVDKEKSVHIIQKS
jgi:hypothetical protein